MKRIKAACIYKTIYFQLKEDLDHDAAATAAQQEAAAYLAALERKRTQYRILEKTTQTDGSVLMKLKMQYNDHPCGDYLD